MKAFRVLIADDEPLSREYLRALTEQDSRFEVTAVCESGFEAVDYARHSTLDVAFLDVRMPGLDGFQTFDGIQSAQILVVFVTAYSDYAVRAYDCGAIDYVTKPIKPSRFTQTLDRLHARLLERAASSSKQTTRILGSGSGSRASLDKRLLTGVREDVLYLDSEIEVIESQANYVNVRIHGESCLVRESLENFYRKLDSPPFVRVHRSFVVNITCVRKIRYGSTGTAELTLADGYSVPVSRRHRNAVADMLRSSLPPDS